MSKSEVTLATIADKLDSFGPAILQAILELGGIVGASKGQDFGDAIAKLLADEKRKFVALKRQTGLTYPGADEEYPDTAPLGLLPHEIEERPKEVFFAEFVLALRLRFPSDFAGVTCKVISADADTVTGYLKNLAGQKYDPTPVTLNPDQIVGFSITQE